MIIHLYYVLTNLYLLDNLWGVILPVIAIYVIFQRQFIKGVAVRRYR